MTMGYMKMGINFTILISYWEHVRSSF